MASIDKIYCDSRKDFVQFYEWCEMFEEECYKETGELLTDYFYLTPLEWPEQDKYRRDVPVTNTPFNIDKWLNLHCPIKFVRDRLLEWGYKPSRKQLLYIEKGFDREKYRQKKNNQSIGNVYTKAGAVQIGRLRALQPQALQYFGCSFKQNLGWGLPVQICQT